MSASKLDKSGVFEPVVMQSEEARLTLELQDVSIRKNGIEFFVKNPIEIWTEMTVDLESSANAKPVHCSGVVVACEGSRHAGYRVSMVLTGLSKQSQDRLNAMAFSRLA